MSVQDPTSTLVAEVTFLLPPAVAHTLEVRNIRVVVNAEEGEDCGCAKGGGGLAAAVDTVAMVEVERCSSWGGEGDGAASTAAVHGEYGECDFRVLV